MRFTFREFVIDQIRTYKFNHWAPRRGVLESTFAGHMVPDVGCFVPNCDALTTPGRGLVDDAIGISLAGVKDVSFGILPHTGELGARLAAPRWGGL
jgi:hypothetical protein